MLKVTMEPSVKTEKERLKRFLCFQKLGPVSLVNGRDLYHSTRQKIEKTARVDGADSWDFLLYVRNGCDSFDR